MTLRLGWFATARGTMSAKLLAAAHDEISAGRLDAEIALVFCNREAGEDTNTDAFLEQVRSYGLPLVTLSSREFRRAHGGEIAKKGAALPGWRHEYDREVMQVLEAYPFDLGVLAGYMLIFCEEAAQRWDLLNLHPAPPGGPAGMWQDVVWHLIATRAERSGVMMHLATPELDQGPVVTYCTYAISGEQFGALWKEIEGRSVEDLKAAEGEGNALFQEIRRQGAAREVALVIETLRALADGRVRIVGKQVVDSTGDPIPGYDLTDRIEALVAERL